MNLSSGTKGKEKAIHMIPLKDLPFSLLIFAVLNLTWLKWKEQPRIWWVGNTSFHSPRIATYHLRFYNSQIVPKPQNLPLQAHFLETEGPLAPAAANSFLNKKRTQLLNLGQASVKPWINISRLSGHKTIEQRYPHSSLCWSNISVDYQHLQNINKI